MTDEDIKNQLERIHARNERVEADKAWETSPFRILSIALHTYLIAGCLLYFMRSPGFYLGALIPAAGYLVSTLSLPFLKNWWITRFWIRK